jgi:hypothetical protein
MKAQQRHQLHTNLLADRLGRFLKDMKSTRQTTSAVVWFMVLVALAAVVVWQYAVHASQAESSALWTEVDEATHNPLSGEQQLSSLAENSPGSFAGRTARFQLARLDLGWNSEAFSPLHKGETIRQVNQARQLYRNLEAECGDSPLLAQEAMMGVAKADEWLIGITHPDDPEKDLQTAVASYERLANQFSNTMVGKEARQRAASLKDHSAEVAKLYRRLNQSSAPAAAEDIFKKVPESQSP